MQELEQLKKDMVDVKQTVHEIKTMLGGNDMGAVGFIKETRDKQLQQDLDIIELKSSMKQLGIYRKLIIALLLFLIAEIPVMVWALTNLIQNFKK
jgi:hypothetical protein